MKKLYNFNFQAKTKPYPHQFEAIDYIRKNKTLALFDEQGLGKTKIVIEALCSNMEKGILDGALIICKKHLIENWKEEIETHSHLKYIILRGSPNEKGMRFMGYSHFYIINYESVIGEVQRLKMFLKTKKMAIVLDESHKIKNLEAKSTKAVFELKDFAEKRIIISGTPLANKPVDLWSQFYFLDNGALLGDNFKKFEETYSVDYKNDNLSKGKDKFLELRDKILANSIRRLKNDVLELPEKIYLDKFVNLKGRQKHIYDNIKNELIIEITKMTGEKVIDESNNVLKKLLRLAQAASDLPPIFDPNLS
jgi:SWI/SNF-related matrix-associated actin-dependent regulator of chromatin subfamily A-like protein 1